MKISGMKIGVGGATVGSLGIALCCLVPGLGLVTAAGMGVGFGVWAESVFAGILLASLGILGFVGYRYFKSHSRTLTPSHASVPQIACDPLVFSKEKRMSHGELSKEFLLRLPKKKTETEDGFVFDYEGDEDRFLMLAQWVSDEHRCCPWGTYAIEAGPSEAGKPGVIQLRWGGSKEGKAFLSDALKYLEDLGDSAPPEEFLNPNGKLTRASFKIQPKGACGC